MDAQAQASFIPKKPLTGGASARGVGLLMIVATLVFAVSLVAAGGVFALDQYTKQQLASDDKTLQMAEGAFDPGVIQDLVRTNSRLIEVKKRLASHVAPSALFAFLSNLTLGSVQFDNFSYSLHDDGSASIALSGKTDSFASVALQSDQFGAARSLKDVVFSNIVVDQGGKVSFSVAAGVDQNAILYSKVVSAVPTNTVNSTAPSAESVQAASTTQQ